MKSHELVLVPMPKVWHRLPVRELVWLPDLVRGDLPIVASSTKPKHRSEITLAGYRAGLKPPNWQRTFPPEPLDDAEIRRLLGTFDTAAKRDVRNRALITVLWRTGLRVSEALDLRPHHVDFQAKRVKVLRGKGSKTRTVAIDNVALAEVSRWVMCRATLGVKVDAPLFCTVNRPTQGNHLHPAYLRTLLRKHSGRAAIAKRVHPHGFRHTMACELWRAGYPLSAIQRQLGHSSAGTTDTYLRGMGADEGLDLIAAREGSHG